MKEIYVITRHKGIAKRSETGEAEIVREISSKEDLEELIERMPFVQTIQAPNIKVRKEFYQMAMNKYEDLEWVKIIKSVYLRMEDRHYEEFEKTYLEEAKKYLYGEISIVFGMAFEEVEQFLNETIERQLDEF